MPPTSTACHSRSIEGGVGCSPTQLPRCTTRGGGKSSISLLSETPPGPDTPLTSTSAALSPMVIICYTLYIHIWGGGFLLIAHTNPVLRLEVRRQLSHRQVHRTFLALDPLFLVVLASHSSLRYYTLVCRIQLCPNNAAGLTNHPDHLPHISPDTHLI